jgi:hypothetical protein
MPSPSTHSRDAALRRLARCNRWLLAGTVTLTGMFWTLAAQAFPGKTVTATGAGTSGKASASHGRTTKARVASKARHAKALKSPAQAPKAASTSTQVVSGGS